eukprot:2458673-Prymnesium_polylepis.1
MRIRTRNDVAAALGMMGMQSRSLRTPPSGRGGGREHVVILGQRRLWRWISSRAPLPSTKPTASSW